MIATRDAYGETLAELGAENTDIVVLDADLSGSTKTAVFAKKFPERFFNMGIAEANMVGTAAGLAAGRKDAFSLHLRHLCRGPRLGADPPVGCLSEGKCQDRRYPRRSDRRRGRRFPPVGGGYRHHARHAEHDGHRSGRRRGDKGAIAAAAAYKGPVYIRLGRNKVPRYFPDDYQFVIGKGCELSAGTDMTFITTGLMTAQALQAAYLLEKEGISARVVHIATIKPLDQEIILAAARETGAIVTAEEHSVIGGLGSAVAELLAENHPTLIKRVGVLDRFGTSGKAEELLKYFGLTPEDLVEAAKEVLAKKQSA